MSKAAILLSIAILFGGGVVTRRAAGAEWQDLFLGGTLDKLALASVLLLAILLTMDDLGAGSYAVAIGVLIALGYLLAASGQLGSTVLSVEQDYFGQTAPTPGQSRSGLK